MEKFSSSKYSIDNFNDLSKKIFYQTLKINLLFIFFFGLIGYIIDLVFNTRPIFIFILIILSMPASIYVLFRKIKK